MILALFSLLASLTEPENPGFGYKSDRHSPLICDGSRAHTSVKGNDGATHF